MYLIVKCNRSLFQCFRKFTNTLDNTSLMKHTDKMEADVVFESVGRNETFSQAVDLTAPQGQICLIGNPYSDMTLEKSVYWKILRNQLTITGTWNSSYTHQENDDWNYALDRLMQKRVMPKDDRFFLNSGYSHILRFCYKPPNWLSKSK